jgi:GNAT superfamily N-acetyltransferase
MVIIQEALTKKQQKEFIDFPLRMYKNNPYFVPPLYGDEKQIFKKNFMYNDQSESVFYNAYIDGKMVGRISGILQRASNEKWKQKRVRFTRFDSIDDQEVAHALFQAVENWARSKGMNEMVGPLGYSDLEREGLLVEGFDQLSTFIEQYNADYYPRLVEKEGYVKEVDWLERKLFLPKEPDDRLERISSLMMRKCKLHFGKAKNTRDFLKKYADSFFEILDTTYVDIYQTVPMTDGMKKSMLANFNLIIDVKHVAVILDENEKVVCFGICFPSIARALQKCQGKLTPLGIIRLLHSIKHPDSIELGLIGVLPEYANKAIATTLIVEIMRFLKQKGIKYAETNLNLEDNLAIQNNWKNFDSVQNKRRRSYTKSI